MGVSCARGVTQSGDGAIGLIRRWRNKLSELFSSRKNVYYGQSFIMGESFFIMGTAIYGKFFELDLISKLWIRLEASDKTD